MDSTQNVSIRKASQGSGLQGSGFQEQKAAMAENGKTLEAHDSNNATAKGSKTFEIPTLEDMTSYLFSNEVIEKDSFPQVATQAEKSFKIPEIVTNENESEENQTLSTRTREKSDSSTNFNQFNAEEIRKEIEVLYKIAQSCASNGDYLQALNFYNRVIALNEKSGSAWVAMGHCYTMIGQDQKALASYENALKLVPNSQKDEQLWYGVGILYQKLEDWTNAEMSFRNALRLDPNPVLKGEILYNLGMVLKSKGDFPEAVKYLTKCILSETFPPEKIVEILCQSGQLQERMNDVEGALKTYKYATMIQENNPKAIILAGWLCYQNDQYEQALLYFNRADALIQNNAEITYIIARCHLKLKQHTTSYDCLHKCLTKEPESDLYWSSLGILFGELNQLKQSYECLTKAVKANAKCAEHFYNLGCLFELSTQVKDAIKMYEKAVEIQPNFTQAVNHTRRLYIQPDLKVNNMENQFKHPPFEFKLFEELKKDTSVLSSPKVKYYQKSTADSGDISKIVLANKNKNTMRPPQSEGKAAESKILFNTNKVPVSFDAKPDRLLANEKLEPPKGKKFDQRLDSESDMSSLKLSRPLNSEPSSTKLPSAHTLNSSIAGLSSFSILQSNYNNINNFLINPVMNYAKDQGEPEQVTTLSSGRSKTDDLSSTIKGPSNDFAKQLSGLQAIIHKNNNFLQSTLLNNLSTESLKPTKNISSPIVLRHNPQVLLANEAAKKMEALKSQGRSEFKLTHRLQRADDEDLAVQKKIKTD